MHHAFEVDRVGSGDVEVGQGIAHAGGDNQATTSGVNNINSTEISKLPVPWCTEDEQEKIVQEIESRLSVCDNIETTIDTALQQAEVLRQSILKQAFEGKLI